MLDALRTWLLRWCNIDYAAYDQATTCSIDYVNQRIMFNVKN